MNYSVPKSYSLSEDEDLPGIDPYLSEAVGLDPSVQNDCCLALDGAGIPVLCLRKRVHVENLGIGLR